MRVDTNRLLAYAVIGLLAVGALRFTPPLPSRSPAERLAVAPSIPAEPEWQESVDTLSRGETLSQLLEKEGLSGPEAADLLRAADGVDERRVPAGMRISYERRAADSLPSRVTFHLAIDRLVRLQRTDRGWIGAEERLPWKTDTIVVSGSISSTLSGALDAAAASLLPARARSELTWTLADIFEYKVDMSRDLQEGDSVRVLFERSQGPNGAVRVGSVLAANLVLSRQRYDAYRYQSAGGSGEYFDGEGKSLRAAFLRAPLAFRRISSVFGLRKHPILGVWRAHKGTDYSASSGTPVRSVGDGVVIYAGWRGGYGRTVEVRHRNGFVSRYGHLRGLGPGVRVGARTTIGKTVGYVGMTGLATAPHLHFEVLVNGVQRNPSVALRQKGGEPIPSRERADFDRVRTQLVAALDNGGRPVLALGN